jgi:hypothetical protein
MQRAEKDLLNRLTRAIDRGQRYLRGIHEFSSDPDCIYRLSIEGAPRDAILPDGTVFHQGEPIGILHIWGDHIPAIPSSGINLAWGAKMARLLLRSTNLLARHVAKDKYLQSISAFGNDAFFLHNHAAVRLLERVGFVVLEGVPANCLHERIRMRTARLWTWLLRRAFNQQSIRRIRPSDLRYRSVWLSRRTLLERYSASWAD